MRHGSVWERVPRLELRFGRRYRVPAWTTLGRTGAAVGAVVFAVASAAAGVATSVVAAVIAACIGSFVAWRAIGRRWRGGRYVLLEFALLACAATVGVTAALGGPRTAVLDRWLIALAVCLAIGRLGCLCHGCCHGQAARRGLRYPWLPPWYDGSRWDELRLFPLQAIEAAVLGALAIAGAWAAAIAPGLAVSLVPAGYAVARFELEWRRGDARRYLGPLSHNQWWCAALAATVAVLGDRAIGAAALAAIGLLLVVRAGRLAAPVALSAPDALVELGRAVDRARAGETVNVGAVVVEPAAPGVRIRPGASSLSRGAARALSAVASGYGRDGRDRRATSNNRARTPGSP